MSTLFLILAVLAAVNLLMIVLQAFLNRAVWGPYFLTFIGLLIGLVLTR